MNIEDVRKIAEEEMTKSIMKNLDSSIIFKYISNLENELKLKDDQIEYVKNEYGRTIEEKDKVINEMAKWLYEDDTSFGYGNLAEVNTQEKIKEYFTNKVEREGK